MIRQIGIGVKKSLKSEFILDNLDNVIPIVFENSGSYGGEKTGKLKPDQYNYLSGRYWNKNGVFEK